MLYGPHSVDMAPRRKWSEEQQNTQRVGSQRKTSVKGKLQAATGTLLFDGIDTPENSHFPLHVGVCLNLMSRVIWI